MISFTKSKTLIKSLTVFFYLAIITIIRPIQYYFVPFLTFVVVIFTVLFVRFYDK